MIEPIKHIPAFPTNKTKLIKQYPDGSQTEEEVPEGYGGMTLRDYFAGQVLSSGLPGRYTSGIIFDEIPKFCYKFADALLKEGEK